MRRREFLIGAATATGLAGTSRLWAQGNQAKLARVGVLSRNFDGVIKLGEGPAADAARALDFLDLPQMVADRFGVHNLELQHSHFVSTEAGYLKDFRDRVTRAKSQIVQINTEFQGSNISVTGYSQRAQGLDLAKVWIDHAEALGCPRVLVNQGSLGQTGVESLKILAEYGKAHKVVVAIENRDNGVAPPPPPPPPAPVAPPAGAAGAAGVPAAGRRGGGGGGQAQAPIVPATWQANVDAVRVAGIVAVPNPAGFASEAERALGLKALYPLSDGNSHVTSSASINLAAVIKIAKDAGYKGVYSIATDPTSADPYAATKAILDELIKLI